MGKAYLELTSAFALSRPSEQVLAISDDVAFFPERPSGAPQEVHWQRP